MVILVALQLILNLSGQLVAEAVVEEWGGPGCGLVGGAMVVNKIIELRMC